MTYQQVLIIGNVGRDPNMRYTPTGVAVCDFSVAVSKKKGSGENRTEETTWFVVTCWEKRAETASQFIRKGMKLMVIGEVKASAYMDKQNKPAASLEITASEFKFLDSKGDTDNQSQLPSRQSAAPGDDPMDVPF